MTIDDDFEAWIFDPRNLTFTEFRFWKAGHDVCCYLDAEPVWMTRDSMVRMMTGMLKASYGGGRVQLVR